MPRPIPAYCLACRAETLALSNTARVLKASETKWEEDPLRRGLGRPRKG